MSASVSPSERIIIVFCFDVQGYKISSSFFFFERLFLRGLPSLMRDRDSKDGNINSRDIWER